MNCPQCGNSCPDGSKFCLHCGAALTQASGVPPVQPPPTSGKAIASLVLGIAGMLCGVTAIPGLILGGLALKDIRTSRGRLSGKGLAVAGIVISAIVLVLMALSIIMIIALTALGSNTQLRIQEILNSLGNAT
jgi:hypothetical protein